MSRTPEAVKHTPGPLQVISGPDGYSPAIALDDKRGAFIIAEMRDQMNGDDVVVDATAERLVLAYNVHEEILEALKAALRQIIHDGNPDYQPMVEQMSAAIAEAEGR